MPLNIRLGMTADELLEEMARARLKEIKAPEIVERGKESLTVRWFLPGQAVTLRRSSYFGPYQVAGIEVAAEQEPDGEQTP